MLPAELAGRDSIELGCGTGYVSAWLARCGARPVGLGNYAVQLATARQLQKRFGLRFPLIHASAEQAPFADAGSDGPGWRTWEAGLRPQSRAVERRTRWSGRTGGAREDKPVPQHTSSPCRTGRAGRAGNALAVASSTPSGVRKGVWSNFGASTS